MSFSKQKRKVAEKRGGTKGKYPKVPALSKTYNNLPPFVAMEFWDN